MTKEQVDEAIENINNSPKTDEEQSANEGDESQAASLDDTSVDDESADDTVSAENNADPLEIADSQIDAIVDDIIEDSSEESHDSMASDSDNAAGEGIDGMTKEIPIPLNVIVNNEEVTLTGKSKYVFVDVFDVIDFDTRDSRGRAIVTLINGNRCGYSDTLKSGDKIDIYWQELGRK